MEIGLEATGELATIRAGSLTIIVKRQDEGVSVYVHGKDGESITETWATFAEGEPEE